MDSLNASRIAGGNSAYGRSQSDFYPTPPEATGIHPSNISRYGKGDMDATIRRLLALEDLTGMTFRELFGECEGRDGRV